MEPSHIGVAAAVGVAVITLIGFWMKLSRDIAKAEGRAEAAYVAAAAVEQEAKRVAISLAEFKEKVARDYVSHEALRQMEDRLVGAIDRLADRMDKLFEPRSPHHRTRSTDHRS